MSKKEEIKKEKKVKKKEKFKIIEITKFQKIELIISAIVGIIFLVLLFFSMTNNVFLPAALISFALFLFCICYYYLEDPKKKTMVYVLFSLGVLLIVIEVIYTIVRVM